ncbi:ribulose 1,5-bisphosphate carboxylase, partial [Candidatus Peregrinibacteria bacterium]|nr:ribulose 1,5-bisphosphate carboxylase [Candidatus Peregrinibacteria bacterium]
MQKQYLGLRLTKKELYSGKYLLAAFTMLPAKGEDFKGLATEVAAESSTGSNMRVSTATSFSDDLNARVYKIDPKKKLAFLAYPLEIFDRGGNVQNVMTYIAGNVYGMSTLNGLRLEDVWFPKRFLDQFDGPAYTLRDLKKYLGIGNRPILGTIVKPKIGLKPVEFAKVCYEFWAGGGDFVKFDEPQADQVFAPFKDVIREVNKQMRKVVKETGHKKVFSINISASDLDTMIERAKVVRKTMKRGSYAFLVDG